MSTKKEDLIQLAKKGGNDADLILFDKINELEEKVETIEEKIEREPAEDTKVEKVAMRLAAKLATLEKGDRGDRGDRGETGKGIDGQDGRNGKDGKDGIDGKDGRNGRDGKDVDEQKIIEDIRAQIKVPTIEEIEGDLPKLSAPIRDALELLTGDEKLGIDAVLGLKELLEELKNRPVRVVSGGARKIRGEKFSFTGDGSTTSWTLPKEPAMDGLGIWAHYQGQWLQPTVHFNITGKTFTTTFTPEDGTIIEGFIMLF